MTWSCQTCITSFQKWNQNLEHLMKGGMKLKMKLKENKQKVVDQVANAVIKAVILFVVFLSLIFFAGEYDNLELIWIAYLLLIAVIWLGLSRLIKSTSDNKLNKQIKNNYSSISVNQK